jgi:hypothetical protein
MLPVKALSHALPYDVGAGLFHTSPRTFASLSNPSSATIGRYVAAELKGKERPGSLGAREPRCPLFFPSIDHHAHIKVILKSSLHSISISVRKALFSHLPCPLEAREEYQPEHHCEIHLVLEPENPRPLDANMNRTISQLQSIRKGYRWTKTRKSGEEMQRKIRSS